MKQEKKGATEPLDDSAMATAAGPSARLNSAGAEQPQGNASYAATSTPAIKSDAAVRNYSASDSRNARNFISLVSTNGVDETPQVGSTDGVSGVPRVRKPNAAVAPIVREVFSIAWPVMLSYVAVGMPCGVLAAKAGMAPWMAGLLSATYLSGGGQFMISNLWLAATPIPSLLASVAAISTRFALYSASLAPHLKRFGKRQSFAITSCFSEEAYGITLSKLAEGSAWTAAHAIALNLTLLATWTASVIAGAILGTAVDIPTALASFAMTALFIYLLWSQPHRLGTAAASIAAAAAVVICKWNGFSGAAVPVAALAGVVAGMASQKLPEGHRDGLSSSTTTTSEKSSPHEH